MKRIAWILVLALVLTVGYVLSSGMQKLERCFISGYSLSQDGDRMTVEIGVATSIGYVRALNARAEDGTLYVDPVSAFGGINGKWGAKSMFDMDVEGIRSIALKRADGYEVVLIQDEEGWRRP